ncbi:MAG: phosphoribosylformylglycinamidine synthase, partial [Candidatus Saccharibacteria bacterium]|nr:phosphoribosylformylglycinamidine synthase [Candidatus Saccharibacteria bacterium]
MQIYKGISAISDFRKEKLFNNLQKIDKNISDVTAEFIHFIDTSQELTDAEVKSLQELLSYGETFVPRSGGHMFLVTPRTGTISPWSSKATDIAKNSGLKNVNRIERGVAYYVKSKDKINRSDILPILHDRMTESILSNIEEAQILFKDATPKALVTIDVLAGGKTALISANQTLGLALADDEIDYLFDAYAELKRNPTDVELMMFAQVNSE